ncbi:hypothetical protein Efla_002682 [Eimeria flavescens]
MLGMLTSICNLLRWLENCFYDAMTAQQPEKCNTCDDTFLHDYNPFASVTAADVPVADLRHFLSGSCVDPDIGSGEHGRWQ